MAVELLSTKDLFLLAIGLYKLKTPGPENSGRDYYLDKDKDYALRETDWNTQWFQSPQFAWERVRHRDWLIAALVAELTGNTNDLVSIAEPVFATLDLLGSEFRPGMPNASEAVKQAVTSKTGYERSIYTTLTAGLSEPESVGRKRVVLGAGMRRRTRVWREESQALQADVEFYVPFLPLPGGQEPEDKTLPNARSINAGLRVSRANGSSIGNEKEDKSGKDLAGVRFNLRIPFTARFVTKIDEEKNLVTYRDDPEQQHPAPFLKAGKWEAGDLVTTFGEPKVLVQKLALAGQGSEAPRWEEFEDWKEFVEALIETPEGTELLNAPVGPLLLETLNDSSGLTDLINMRSKLKKDTGESKKELDDALKLLKSIWEKNTIPPESEDPDAVDPHASLRRLGGMLETLGFLKGKPGSVNHEYSLKLSEVTVWDVLGRLLDELDGFPLYVRGTEPKDKDRMGAALSLASQQAYDAAQKHFFGIAGMAYDIAVNPAPAKKEAGPEEVEPEEENPVLILGERYFTDDENLILDDDEDIRTENEHLVIDDDEENARIEDRHLVLDDDDDEEVAPPVRSEALMKGDAASADGEKKSTVDIRLQLGKWFSGETLDDNWFSRLLPLAGSSKSPFKRRAPLPGFRFFPFLRTLADGNNRKDAVYSVAVRGDLLSLGVDIKGRTKEGLTFLKLGKGPLSYFGLGAFEARVALLFAAGRIAFGVGVKLKDMRLSFAPKEKEKEKEKEEEQPADEIIIGLQGLLGGDDDWVKVAEPEKKKERTAKTRLGGKRKDKFSISAGYLTPLADGGKGTLDVQLYDEKGVRGKTVWIPVERRALAVYLKDIGIGLKGLENVELDKGLPDSARLTVALNGGLRWPVFELGFIGASLSFPLNDFGQVEFALEGLDISVAVGPAVISGAFMKKGLEYIGSLTIELPKLSIAAIGMYGQISIFEMKADEEVLERLRRGQIHPKLTKELSDHKIKPADLNAVANTVPRGAWIIRAQDGKQYTVVKEADKLHLVSPDKAVFVYGAFSAGTGGGIQMGPIELTAVALGFGLNRRLKVPAIEDVADFPLVKMVVGEGGYQKDDKSGTFIGQVSKAVEPSTLLKDLGDSVVAESGQYFVCGGARFTIARVLDCFALVVVQWGNELEISLLGLARLKQPSDPSAKPFCYVELQILMSLKPSEGTFKLQGLLTDNSWVFNKDCKLTGGFAVFVWYKGAHAGDFVVTFGGYHPRFKRPEHYPVVPRFALNWQISSQLSVKGSGYLAFTPSCGMAGAKLEAVFRSDRVSVWFTAYFDVIVNWSPFFFEADIGVSLRVEVKLFLFTLKVTISAALRMWGPPVGGIARIEISVITLDIPFGAKREDAAPKPIESWRRFCESFLNPSAADQRAAGANFKQAAGADLWKAPITHASLVAGRSKEARLPTNGQAKQEAKPQDGVWKVRPDQLELGAMAAVPVTTLNVGRVKTNSPPVGVQERRPSGSAMLVSRPVELEAAGLKVQNYDRPLGVHPMGKTLKSVLNVTVVRDDIVEAVDLSRWYVEAETSSLPAALWDASKPKPGGPKEPSAELVPDCITGVKRLKPPAGRFGAMNRLTKITWRPIEPTTVPRSNARQDSPTATRPRDVQQASAAKQDKQKSVADALAAVGFNLAWRPSPSPVRFRELQAEPLAGSVAPSVN
jgi:hypothetical protein